MYKGGITVALNWIGVVMLHFRRDRNSKDGGGLILYLRNDIECSRRKDLEHDIVEAVWLEITLKHKKILLAVTYRTPNEHTVS